MKDMMVTKKFGFSPQNGVEETELEYQTIFQRYTDHNQFDLCIQKLLINLRPPDK